jgi:hypothetical protein
MAVSEQKRVQKKIGRIEATTRNDATLAARSAFTDYFLSP